MHGNDKQALHRSASEQRHLGPLAALKGKFELCHTDPSIANLART